MCDYVILHSLHNRTHQCRSKGNISGEGGGGRTRVPEARAARGIWGHAPPENVKI